MGHPKNPNSLKILKTWRPPVPGFLPDPAIVMCTQGSDISDSSHSSTTQGFIVFGTKTLKLPFASGKTLPWRFPTYQVCVQEKRKLQKHLSDLEHHPVFPAREFSPTGFLFKKILPLHSRRSDSGMEFIEDSKGETSSVSSNFRSNLSVLFCKWH